MIRWPRSYVETLEAAESRIAAIPHESLSMAFGVLEYSDRGSGQPVLVSHGVFGGFDAALGHADSYLGDGFRVIGPSRFGYLGSTMPTHATPRMQADVYCDLLDHLCVDRAVVFGFSAGTCSALWFAVDHPQRCAGLVVGSGHYPQTRRKIPASIFRPLYTDRFFWALKTLRPRALWEFAAGLPKDFELTASAETTVRLVMESLFPIGAKRPGATFDTVVSNPDVDNVPLEAIAVPTLLVHAADDQLAPYPTARPAADRIRDARLITIARGAHLLLGAEPQVRHDVSTFVRSVMAIAKADG